MHPANDNLSEYDLNGYVDGQMDEWQRLRVETHLAHHPEVAARMMQDLRLRRELRLAFGPVMPASGQQRALAARLGRALRRDERMRRAVRLVPVVALIGIGWLAHAGFGPLSVREVAAAGQPAPVVAAAIAAREASLVRMPMRSQQPSSELDAAEMRAATGIRLPDFDRNWQVADAQVFPSPQGPGVEIVFDTPKLGRLTHFAVRSGSFAVTMPHSEQHGGRNLAWFQIGEIAHVLIADEADAEDVLGAARRLSSTLY